MRQELLTRCRRSLPVLLLLSVLSVLLLPSSAWSSTTPPAPTAEPTATATVTVIAEPTETATVVVTEPASGAPCGTQTDPCVTTVRPTSDQSDWLLVTGVGVCVLVLAGVATLVGSWRK